MKWIRDYLTRIVLRGLANDLRAYPGIGAVARAYLGGATIEACMSLYAICSPNTRDDRISGRLNMAIDLYRSPARDVLPGSLRAAADILMKMVTE